MNNVALFIFKDKVEAEERKQQKEEENEKKDAAQMLKKSIIISAAVCGCGRGDICANQEIEREMNFEA